MCRALTYRREAFLSVDPGNGLREHQQALIQRQRCPRCAERASAARILKGETCVRCGVRLRIDESDDHAREVLAAIQSGWARSRMVVYGAVVGATFLTGFLPMVAAVATTIAMTLANVLLVRAPLQWIPPGRRVWTWLKIDAWFAAITAGSFLANAVAALFPGVGPVLSAVTGLVATLLYVEGSLALVSTEVARISRVAAGAA